MSGDKVGFLKGVSLFMSLTSDEISKISGIMEEETFQSGDIVIAEGTPGEALFVLLTGEVVVEKIFYDEKVKIATLKPGAALGEMSLVDNYPTSATVTTSQPSTILVLYQDKLRTILAEDAELSSKFWLALSQILCNRIRAANDGLREYFIINQALVENPQFRELYALSHGASMK